MILDLIQDKTGCLLILFAGLITNSYVRHIWNATNQKKVSGSTRDILDEMR